jgi:hypothetical protein
MKFKEPNLFEFILYDLENFEMKSFREKISIAVHFSEENDNWVDFSFSQSEDLVNEFKKSLKGESNVVSFRR